MDGSASEGNGDGMSWWKTALKWVGKKALEMAAEEVKKKATKTK